jgi:tetratricopeptide (TPR) repeat protein
MSEQNEHEVAPRAANSSIAKMLLGKVFTHKVFSDRMLLWLLLGLSFLLPIFFLPGQILAPEFAKMVLLEVAVFVGIFAWAGGRLRDGKIEVPRSLLLFVLALLVLQFVAAAVASPAPTVSFFGSGYDLGTVNTFVVLFLLMFLSSVVFGTRDRILSLFASFMLSGVVVMIYHLARHFLGASFLDFGIFTNEVSTPVGKWNDFAAMLGGIMLLVLSTLYFFPHNKALRLPSYIIFTVGLFFLLVINFTILWIILSVLLCGFCLLALYEGEQRHKQSRKDALESGSTHVHKPLHKRVVRHLPRLAFVLLAVAFLFGSGIADIPLNKNGMNLTTLVGKVARTTSYTEVVLTPRFTYDVVKGAISESPFFGTGPNRFSYSYLQNKESSINQSPFWDSAFDFGIGRIPTYFGTTGLIGLLLWIAFSVFLFMKWRKVMQLFAKDRIAVYLAFSLFLLTVYFWSIAFFYLPNIAIFSIAFLFTGALVAFLAGEGVVGMYMLKFEDNARLSFVVTPLVIVVLVGTIAAGVLLTRQVNSLRHFRDAQIALSTNNIDAAEASVIRANALFKRDVNYRSLSNIALMRLSQLALQDLPPEEITTRANQLVGDARQNAENAIVLDSTNFENYLQLGGVYDTLGSLGVQNTTQLARQNYEQALRLNPKSPRVFFVLARLEYISGDRAKAKEYLYRALAERPNYSEAISFISQLELQDKNPQAAIVVLRAAVAVEPTNFLLRFAAGYLYFLNGEIANSIVEFESAVILNPVYADAKYFLGLAYAKAGRTQDSIAQFTDVLTLNPDNKDLANIIRNLKAGRDPFAPPYVAPTKPVEDALEGLNNASAEN